MLPNNSPDALSGNPVGVKDNNNNNVSGGDANNNSKKWTVYGRKTCGWTLKQKKYMEDNDIDYDYIDCKENPNKCPDNIKGFPYNVSPNGEIKEGYTEI